MFPAPFELHEPRDLAEAMAMLARLGDSAKLLAGGHSLLPMMKLRFASRTSRPCARSARRTTVS
jgi:carbon-monoxide dehydrogenase medium subunit